MLPRPAWLAVGAAAAAGAALCGGVVGASSAAAVLIAAACLADALRRRAAAGLAAAALGAALVVARLALGGILSGSASGPSALPDGPGPWPARVESARISKGFQLATLEVRPAGAGRESILCSALVPTYPRLIAGDVVAWSGRIEPLDDSDYSRYLAARGISATCDARDLSLVRHDDSPAGLLERFRQASGDALQRVLPEPEGGLAAAIMIGLRDRVDRDVATAFTAAGVSHIVAISGWNIAIVAATVAALLRGLASRRRRSALTVGAIVAYTVFAGASASVVRAAVMAGVALLAAESGRGSRAIVGLAWAVAAMLLVAPAVVGDVGFQLSAAATAGLIAWGTPLTRRLEAHAAWLPGPLRESLGISLAAQAATLPIALLAFGRLAPIAPAANLVAVPLVPPAMAAGAVSFVAGWLVVAGAPVWLTGLLALPAWLLLSALVLVVDVAASVPGANATLPFPANAVGAALAGLGLWWLNAVLRRPPARAHAHAARRPRASAGRSRTRWAVAGAGLSLVLVCCVAASRPDGCVHVIVLDVGQGDSILLEGNRGSRILIDGGPDSGVLLAALDRQVPPWDRRLDAVVLTHPHDDHVTGLVGVLERYRVGLAFESGRPGTTPAYEAWLVALASRGLTAERLSAGDRLRLDDATLEVLWPDDGLVAPAGLDPDASVNRVTNDSSIVLLGDYEGRSFLITGDVEDDVDPKLLERGLPGLDLLKVAHHGSSTASSDAFLAAIHPAVAVISVGADNDYGHPAPSTLARLRAHGAAVLRTDEVGTVDVKLDRAAVTATSARSTAGDGPQTAVWPAIEGTGLLYDADDDRTKPSRERGPASLAGSSGLASAPLARRRRDRRLAGSTGRPAGSCRSPPRGGGRPPARPGQAAGREGARARAPARRRHGRMAGPAGLRRAGAARHVPPGDATGRRRVVRAVDRDGLSGGADRFLRRQAGRPATGTDGSAIRPLAEALSAPGAD
jgi:competence protein ComEC